MSDVLTALLDMLADRVAERLAVPNTGRLLTTAEAARETGQSASTIRAAVAAGELAHIRVGRIFKFRRSDLDAWIDRSRIA